MHITKCNYWRFQQEYQQGGVDEYQSDIDYAWKHLRQPKHKTKTNNNVETNEQFLIKLEEKDQWGAKYVC